MVWRVGVCRPSSMSQLYQNLFGGFLSNFSCSLPWVICSDGFWKKKKGVFQFFAFLFSFSLTWTSWEQKLQNNTKSPQTTFENFQIFAEFPSRWSSQKCCFGFWIFVKLWVYDFSHFFFFFFFFFFLSFFFFASTVPYEWKSVGILLLPQIAYCFWFFSKLLL